MKATVSIAFPPFVTLLLFGGAMLTAGCGESEHQQYRAQQERLSKQAAQCAVEKMSAAAKTELAKREHETRMKQIGSSGRLLLGAEPSDYVRDWNRDIVGPLLRSCDYSPDDRGTQYLVAQLLFKDDEYRQLMAPLNAEYRKASYEFDEAKQAQEQKTKAERAQQEAWLMKEGADRRKP